MNLIYQKRDNTVLTWLITGAVMIFIMVIIGGTTRLTGSGLSMVEWKVVGGTIPPMNDMEWQDSFEKYKQFPQYNLENQSMTLVEYKGIFFWEYLHRMWGRLIGIVFIIPFLIFLLQKRFDHVQRNKLFVLLFLGASQGGVGWFMVLSGLDVRPSVSHYRLTIHFFMALLLFAYLLRLIFEQVHKSETYKVVVDKKYFSKLKLLSNAMLGMLLLQIMYGGFMAGLKAYQYAPSYPFMNGDLIPFGLFSQEGVLINFFENPMLVNFMHRWIPVLLAIVISFSMVMARKAGVKPILGKSFLAVTIVFTLQFLLGVITLITVPRYEGHVHVHLGVTHQATAVILFLFVLVTWFQVKKIDQEN